jgi:hypothetical protein
MSLNLIFALIYMARELFLLLEKKETLVLYLSYPRQLIAKD